MPNASPITLQIDDQSIIMSPDSVGSTHVRFQHLDEPKMQERKLLHFDRPASGGTIRRSVRTSVPLPREDNNGNALPPKLITIKSEFIATMDSSTEEREAAYKMHLSALEQADVKVLFVNPEWVW